jgi:hypothetical protein
VVTDWAGIVARQEARYAAGTARLPDRGDTRQKQLVRLANAAAAAGLAELMRRRRDESGVWLGRAAMRYRESWDGAPAESWGRPIGAVKARLLASDGAGAEDDARWTLALGAAEAESPIGRYAATLALLVLGEDGEAGRLARSLQEAADAFPREVADALRGLADGDAALYASAVAQVLRSFEERETYLEDVPVADTVLVLEALAERRGLALHPASALLPGP